MKKLPAHPTKPTRLWTKRLGVSLLFSIMCGLGLPATAANQSAESIEELAQSLFDQPDVQQAFIAAFDALAKNPAFAHTKNLQEEIAAGERYAKLGLRRLPTPQIKQVLNITLDMFEQIGLNACGKIAKGQAGTAEQQKIFQALNEFPAAKTKLWFNLSRTAMEAEINNFPPPASLSQAQAIQALDTIVAYYTKEQRIDLYTFLQSRTSVSDQQACEVTKRLYKTAINVPEPHAKIVLQAMALR